MYCCKYCGKIVGNAGCLKLHETQCNDNPDRIYRNTNANRIYRPLGPSWNSGQTKDTNESLLKISNTLKTKYKNGELTPSFKGKHHTEETKQKIRESLQHWKDTHQDEYMKYSSGKSKCCENFKSYLRSNGIDFVEEYCPYPDERLFSLDIAWPDEKIAIEINGSQHYDSEGNLNTYTLNKQQFFEEHGWKIIQIYYKWCYGVINQNAQIKSIFDLPIHNKNYVKEIYKRSYVKKQKEHTQKCIKNTLNESFCNERKNILKNLIENSGIDFTKACWSKYAVEYLEKRNELFDKLIFRALRKYYPEFFEIPGIWIRKGSKI